MEFKSNVNADCCTPTGKYELCGCVNGVPYIQLTVVGGGTVQTAWLNTETGDTFTSKPAGFLTGTCSEASASDILKFSGTAPTGSTPFASPKDGYTTVVTDDGTATGDVTGIYLYDAETATWVKVPVVPAGGTAGQILTKLPDGSTAWVDPEVQAIMDDQVLTGDTSTNTTVTLTPATVADQSGGDQVNYTVKAEVKIDGTTIVENPTTKVLSAANQKPDALTAAQPTPSATGNTTNLNTIFTDVNGVTWFVDFNGDAVQMSSPIFKELNRFYVDPNGNDTTGTGANENPFKTAQAGVDAAAQGDNTILNEGVYTAVTMDVQNTTLAGACGAYGSLTQIAGVTVATASGTSNKLNGMTVTGDVARTGNAPLYMNNITVSGNVTLAGTAYTEIRDSSMQDGSITQSGQSVLFIEDSKIGSSTFSTAGSTIAMRNVTIDAGDCVTIGAGVVYSLQDVNGCVNIDPAAINAEAAAVAAGLSATLAEGATTSHFHHIRMLNADLEASPTQVVTRDPATGELEYSPLSAIAAPSAVWVDATTNPTATGNTGTLPRFVNNTVTGDKWYIDSTGKAVKIESGPAPDPCGVVFFNSTTPATATIFDDENPPVTNDDTLKNLDCAIYIGTDGSQWSSNGTTYKTYTPSCRPKVKVVTANYTLTAADEGYMIYANSATPITITAPAGLPAGFIAEIYQEGAGQVTVVGGAGNTLRSANGFKTRVQHSAIGVSYQTTALSNIVGDSTV